MTSKYLLPADEDEESYGPAMRALSIQQRKFVQALFENPGHGAGARSARAAGFGHATSKPLTFARIANRLFHNPKVLAAIQEMTRALLRAEAPQAVQAVHEIMADRDHKDRLRAALGVIERLDPVETRSSVEVTHRVEPSTLKLVEWMRHFRDDLGLDRRQIEGLLGPNRVPDLEEMEAEMRRRGEFQDDDKPLVLATDYRRLD